MAVINKEKHLALRMLDVIELREGSQREDLATALGAITCLLVSLFHLLPKEAHEAAVEMLAKQIRTGLTQDIQIPSPDPESPWAH